MKKMYKDKNNFLLEEIFMYLNENKLEKYTT